MFLSAKETQGVPIAVYDARGCRHESVLWCDTELGLIGAMYEFAPGSEREYSAPAPLRLVNIETGHEISDELDLAVASAFLRLKWKHESQWERLERRQEEAFRHLRWAVAPALVIDGSSCSGSLLVSNTTWLDRKKPTPNLVTRLTNALARGKVMRWLFGRT